MARGWQKHSGNRKKSDTTIISGYVLAFISTIYEQILMKNGAAATKILKKWRFFKIFFRKIKFSDEYQCLWPWDLLISREQFHSINFHVWWPLLTSSVRIYSQVKNRLKRSKIFKKIGQNLKTWKSRCKSPEILSESFW